jgi:hypothetical protein
MAQAGYTPIQLYYSTTTTNTPAAGDLANGELAINIPDGKLFYNDGGTVKVIASTASTTNVSSFQTSLSGLTPSTATTGAVTLAGTLGVTSGGTGSSTAFTTGSVVFAGASGVYSQDNANFFWDDTNNRLGIGTASPSVPLSIYNATNSQLHVSGDSTTLAVISRYSTDASSPIIALRKGRGTFASPTAVASGDTLGVINFQGYAGTNVRNLSSISGFVETYTSDTNISSLLTFGTSPSGSATPTERMRIDSSGNVGIGASPSYKLDVQTSGSFNVIRSYSSNAGGFFRAQSGANIIDLVIDGSQAYIQNKANIPTVFFTNDTERMRIDSSGNVGIGTASPAVKLDVIGSIEASPAATQDGIIIAGRAGGTSSYAVTLTPTTLTASRTITLPDATTTMVGTDTTQTLTNKRVTPRAVSITGAAGGTITPTGDTADQYNITALGAAATFAIPSGTPTDGQKLSIRIEDNGTGRALTWTTSAGGYRVIGTTLPTTTTATKTIYVGCVYNSNDSFWDVVAVATQA